MPLARIVRSDPARRDIGDIYQHLAHEAGLEIADTVLARITEALYRAADRRRGGPKAPSQTCSLWPF
jgi:plasmid stabilization system protein ParE